MELKQRKKINNIPKFNNGIDSKVGFGQQYQANDLTSMIGGNAPAGSAIAGAGSSSASFNIGQTPASRWNPKGGVQAAGGGGISAGTVSGAVNGTIGMIQGYNSMQNAVKGTDELMAYSGQRTDQTFGVNYQAQNDINRQKAMNDISKSNKMRRQEWLDLEPLLELLQVQLYLVQVHLQEEQLELSQDYSEACLEVKSQRKIAQKDI